MLKVNCEEDAFCACKLVQVRSGEELYNALIESRDYKYVYLTQAFINDGLEVGIQFGIGIDITEEILSHPKEEVVAAYDDLFGFTDPTDTDFILTFCEEAYFPFYQSDSDNGGGEVPDVSEPSIVLEVIGYDCGLCLPGGIRAEIRCTWANLPDGEELVVHGSTGGEQGNFTWYVNQIAGGGHLASGVATQFLCVPELESWALWATTETIETDPQVFDADGCIVVTLSAVIKCIGGTNLQIEYIVNYSGVNGNTPTEMYALLMDSSLVGLAADLSAANGSGTLSGTLEFVAGLPPGENVQLYVQIAGVQSNYVEVNVPACP